MNRKLKSLRNLIVLNAALLALSLAGAMLSLFAAGGHRAAAGACLLAAILLLIPLLILVLPSYGRLCKVMLFLTVGDERQLIRLFGADSREAPKAIAEDIKKDILSEQDLNYQSEIEKKQILLSTLQRQINPHFLYNTLDCIRGEALLREQPELADIISVLSSFFRYSISRKGNVVSVYEEIQNVQNYYKIQQFRFSELAPLQIKCDGNQSEIYDTLIPKLTLQPLVENAISHGLSGRIGLGQISLSFAVTGHDLIIRCRDNGVGIAPDRLNSINSLINSSPEQMQGSMPSSGTGIGLRNVNRRILLLFGRPYGMTVYSAPGEGTCIEIRIPSGLSAQDGGAP